MDDSDDAAGGSAGVTAGSIIQGDKPRRTASFMRGVGVLASGTVIAQLILLAAAPILTRLFTPSQFGELAVFSSIGAIAALIATGRYEYAIALPGEASEARRITWLVILTGALAAVVYWLLILGIRLGSDLIPGQAASYIFSPWVMLLPVYAMLAAALSGLQYWQQRHRHYAAVTYSSVGQSVAATLINLAAGYLAIQHGLIYGLLGGLVAAIATLLAAGVRFPANLPSLNSVWSMACEYSAFPRFSIPGDLAASLSQNIIPLMFAFTYAPQVVGFFALANRILRIPSIVFTGSVGNVFRNEAVEALQAQGRCIEIYHAARRRLVFLGVPSYLVLAIVSPRAFEWVFGPDWAEAGRFAQWICVLAAVEFVAVPLNTLFYIRGAQKTYMWFQLGSVASCVAAAAVAHATWSDPLSTLKMVVVVMAICNLVMLWATERLSRERVAVTK
jgi:teichuronic acid exporter